MGMAAGVPAADRLHIGFFGRRNAGKSSVVNAVTEQNLSVVSDVKGTTTDPVKKTMELLPIGPVVIIDTPGFDDDGTLGSLRVGRTRDVLNLVDLAVLVVDATVGLSGTDQELIRLFRQKKIPYVIAWNKADLLPSAAGWEKTPEEDLDHGPVKDARNPALAKGSSDHTLVKVPSDHALVKDSIAPGLRKDSFDRVLVKDSGDPSGMHGEVYVSAREKKGIDLLKEVIGRLGHSALETKGLLDGLIAPGDLFVLVIPVDSSAPKGRLILPQQMMLSEILTSHGRAVCVQPRELATTLQELPQNVRLVITDSQAFREVSRIVPEDVPLTSFSVLMARYKGLLDTAVRGVTAVERLQDGDRILISEGCTHHRQCDDIGTYKIPKWLGEYTGKSLRIDTSSGYDFPDEIRQYAMVIHCGGCMLNEREVRSRMRQAEEMNVPFTNYGVTIAYMNHILERSLRIFPELHTELEKGQSF